MKNLFKSASINENFAGFIFLEGDPYHETEPTKEKKESDKDKDKDKKREKTEVVKNNTEIGKNTVNENNKGFDKIMQSTEELGMAELLNKSQIEKISKDLENILQNPKNISAIKNGDIGISVYGSASHHNINNELNYNIDGKNYSIKNNWELAKLRANMAEEITRKILAKNGIFNPIIRKEIPVGETNQDGVGKNDKRISGVALFKMDNPESIINSYDKVIIDRSGSMDDDKEFVAEAEKQGKADNLLLNNSMHGDILEQDLNTIAKQLKDLPKNSKVILITDENDDWGRGRFKTWQEKQSAYINKFKEIRKVADDKNIQVIIKFINPKNPKEHIKFDYFRNNMGAMMGQGKNDMDTWNKLKRMSEYYAQKDKKKYNNDVASL